MSAPVLSILEQKASISGKKKKKKTIKNVLNVPDNLKFKPKVIDSNCVKKLEKILERLLPTARILVEKQTELTTDSNEQTNNETQLKTVAKHKRNQLALGVNALNRSIKNNLISSALFADNIQPKFLIHHLNLLCFHEKIPFLHMPGLREITNKCLGFPCIAVGFKKDYNDFSEAVEEIISVSKSNSKEAAEETESDDSEEISDVEISEKKNSDTSFGFLYRTSVKERIFIPEKSDQNKKTEELGFINVKKYESENDGFQVRLPKSGKKLKNLKSFDNPEVDDNEDLEVPKKKSKKNWVIDTKGERQNIRYYPANVMRFPSNPDRISKK